MTLSLTCLCALRSDQIAPIQEAAQAEAVRFIDRLVAEYVAGINCFNQPGEVLFGMFEDQHLVGIGGLNRDPYHSDQNYGRVRHVYVLPAYRRLGIARLLMIEIINAATGVFEVLTLYTSNPDAARLYDQLGFVAVPEERTTHVLALA
jgi:GNAT superfamily N-acetyltransferase